MYEEGEQKANLLWSLEDYVLFQSGHRPHSERTILTASGQVEAIWTIGCPSHLSRVATDQPHLAPLWPVNVPHSTASRTSHAL